MKPKLLIAAVLGLVLITVSTCVANDVKTEVLHNVKVIDKEQQMIIKDGKTEYRYLVITDKGTFICESSMLNGKFNNSDIFYRIHKDTTYATMKVCGFGKSFAFDYQNVLEIQQH